MSTCPNCGTDRDPKSDGIVYHCGTSTDAKGLTGGTRACQIIAALKEGWPGNDWLKAHAVFRPTRGQIIQYLAHCIYCFDSVSQGAVPVLWGCLRQDLKSQYVEKAQLAVDQWVKQEDDASTARLATDKNTEKFRGTA